MKIVLAAAALAAASPAAAQLAVPAFILPVSNQLSDEEVTWILTCPDPKLVAYRLDRIDSEVALSGLLAGARETSSISRQQDLADRVLRVNPRAVTFPGSVNAGDQSPGRPEMLDMDALHRKPVVGDVAELAPGARASDGSLMVEPPPRGAPAPEPRTVTVKHPQRDAAIGAAAGAILGATTSRNKVKGGIIGGAAGAILGGVIGNNVDKKTKTVP